MGLFLEIEEDERVHHNQGCGERQMNDGSGNQSSVYFSVHPFQEEYLDDDACLPLNPM